MDTVNEILVKKLGIDNDFIIAVLNDLKGQLQNKPLETSEENVRQELISEVEDARDNLRNALDSQRCNSEIFIYSNDFIEASDSLDDFDRTNYKTQKAIVTLIKLLAEEK